MRKAQNIFDSEVIIGESATRINEGEPFIFKGIEQILNILSQNKNHIIITTSGSYVTDEIVHILKSLYSIELNISLNSSNADIRKKIMDDNNSQRAINTVKMLSDNNIRFNGSIVALNLDDDFKDLISTIKFLNKYNAEFIRVFIPGYSVNNSKEILKIDAERLKKIIRPLRYDIPVLIEPSKIHSNIIIQGVIKDSYAKSSGLIFEDEILKIDNIIPVSSQHAYEMLNRLKDPQLTIKRETNIINMTIKKDINQRSGLLFYMDLSENRFYEIKKALEDINSKICVSELSENFFIQRFGREKVHVVKNLSFGGNISCNGLLSVTDIINSLNNVDFNRLILHSNFLDNDDRDIFGRSVYDIVTEKNVNISLM